MAAERPVQQSSITCAGIDRAMSRRAENPKLRELPVTGIGPSTKNTEKQPTDQHAKDRREKERMCKMAVIP